MTLNLIVNELMSFATSAVRVAAILAAVVVVLVLFVLVAGTLLGAIKRRFASKKSGAESGLDPVAKFPPGTDWEIPGIDPATCATPDEQREAVDRLTSLPQFLQLVNGDLVDMGNGATLSTGDCGGPSSHHLEVSWKTRSGSVGLVTRRALGRYLDYQGGVAAMLRAASPGMEGNDYVSPSAITR